MSFIAGIPSPIDVSKAAVGDDILKSRIGADVNPRFVINADGSMEWGDGTTAALFATLLFTGGTKGSQIKGTNVGGNIINGTANLDGSNPASHARAVVSVGPAGGPSTAAGDPFISFIIQSASGFIVGMDNSLSDDFFVANGAQDASLAQLRIPFAGGSVSPGGDNLIDLGVDDTMSWRSCYLAAPRITKGSGTGFTLQKAGEVRRLTYKCTVTFAALAAAALTADKIIGTLPAKARIVAVYMDVTTKFIGGAVSAATLKLGSTVGGAEVFASFDVFTAAVTKGLADADLGSSLVRAAAIQGGFMPSFTATTGLNLRITTVTANTNALTQGVVTIYIECEVLP